MIAQSEDSCGKPIRDTCNHARFPILRRGYTPLPPTRCKKVTGSYQLHKIQPVEIVIHAATPSMDQ
jgi:hypothetical protein